MMTFGAQLYKLDDRNEPVVATDHYDWADWMFRQGIAARRVDATVVKNVEVITSFLGADHSFGMSAEPILFETFGFLDSSVDDWRLAGVVERYHSYDQAVFGHQRTLRMFRAYQSRFPRLAIRLLRFIEDQLYDWL
jgi:hypothetical protein